MPKIVDQPILMVTESNRPKRFFWFKRWVNVYRIMDKWKEVGRWWENEQEKLFFRVLSTDGSIYEVYTFKNNWNLYKIYD